MIKGGYKIVNFNGAALSGSPEVLPGIYAQIVDDYDKPVMVSGVSLNGDIMDDAYAGVQEKVAGDLSKSVELTVYGGIITVTEDDKVSFVLSKTTAEIESFLTKKTKNLNFEDISANSYADVTDATLANKLIVGYQLFSVASYNTSLIFLRSDNSGMTARLRNNESQTISGVSIGIDYIG